MSSMAILSSAAVSIHAVARPLISRLESSLSEVLGTTFDISWRLMPGYSIKTLAAASEPESDDALTLRLNLAATETMYSAEIRFVPSLERAANLASELAKLQVIWFEVSVPCSADELGQRYCYTPVLGMFHSQLDQAGNQVFTENQLLCLMTANLSESMISARLGVLLGVQWDQQLEPLRKVNLENGYRTELAS